MQKIQKACDLLDKKHSDPVAISSATSSNRQQHVFDNEIIKIVSRKNQEIKDK